MEENKSLKLDIGCGPNKQKDHIGIDIISFDNVDIVLNAGQDRLPFDDDSVDEIHTSHFVEHLEAPERIHLINEAYRVLKSKGKMTIIVPHWASCRAYGDLTHKWPPVSEFWFYYLNKEWRESNAPHSTYNKNVDFDATWGYNLRPDIMLRNVEFQQFAAQNYKEVISDIIATLIKK